MNTKFDAEKIQFEKHLSAMLRELRALLTWLNAARMDPAQNDAEVFLRMAREFADKHAGVINYLGLMENGQDQEVEIEGWARNHADQDMSPNEVVVRIGLISARVVIDRLTRALSPYL